MEHASHLQSQFHECMPIFIALGDEVRLAIIETLSLKLTFQQNGLNVNEITQKTSLSRPAISHHLKILKDAGLVSVRREGTANYYYLTIEQSTRKLMDLGSGLENMIHEKSCPAGGRTSCEKVYPSGHPDNTCPAGGRTSCEKV